MCTNDGLKDELTKVKIMGSRTMKTRNIRRNKSTKQGKKRKHENNNKGSTPKFAIHPDKK